jgi:hypothetical protein
VTGHAEQQIATQLASLRATVEAGFIETHRRMDHANARLDSMDAALRKTQERVAEHGVRIETHTKDIAEQSRVVDGLRQNLHELAPVAELAKECLRQLGNGRRRGGPSAPADDLADALARPVTRWDVKLVLATIGAVVTVAMVAWRVLEWLVRL